MRRLIALTGALVAAGSASADLTGMIFTPIDHGNPDYVTYRAYARFDNPFDAIRAYLGGEDEPLFFSTDAPSGIYNDDGWPQGHLCDIPYGNLPNIEIDTWLTIGQIGGFQGFPDFSPDFLGVPGGEELKLLVDGLTSFSDDRSAVFFPDSAKPVNTWGDNDVPIDVALAQFTVADYGDPTVEFGAVIQWVPEGGEVTQTYMTATIPAPGAMALLGLAGLVGRRHR
jgi:hypothetical protein